MKKVTLLVIAAAVAFSSASAFAGACSNSGVDRHSKVTNVAKRTKQNNVKPAKRDTRKQSASRRSDT